MVSRKDIKGKVIFTLDGLPLAVVAGLAGFGVVAMLCLLAGQFHAWLIWPLGLLAAGLCAWPAFALRAYQRPGSRKAQVICDALVLVGVAAWGGWNVLYTSQHVITDRDPATYAVTAGWLAEHSGFTQQASNTFAGMPQLGTGSAGFMEVVSEGNATLHPQGQHLLPALLGSVGKVVGGKHALRFNVLFGMTALLSMYCFGRLLMRPGWALLATAAVGLSFPLLYLSRDTYTEPLALTFTFGGLSFLWLAMQRGRPALWMLAGLLMGMGVLARIDGYLVLIGAAAFFAAYLTLGGKSQLRLRLQQAAIFWLPALACCVLAWLDLAWYSSLYLSNTRQLIQYEQLALVTVLAVGITTPVIVSKHVNILTWCDRFTKHWRAWAAALLVLVAGVFFASRPLWYHPLGEESGGIVRSIQKSQGDKIEPRTYDEQTVNWVSWYIGPLMAGLGLLGLAAAAHRATRDKTLLLMPALAIILGSCLVYFVAPSITPDQPWASRRMVPVILPGIALFGGYALGLLLERLPLRSRWAKGVCCAAASAAVLALPAAVSAPFATVAIRQQYAIAGDACEKLPQNAVVVMAGLARLNMVQPVKTYCGVETYNSRGVGPEGLKEIARKAREQGKVPVLGIYRSQYGGLINESDWPRLTELGRVEYREIARTLEKPPSTTKLVEEHLSLAVINSDGSLAPLPKR